MTYDYKQYWKEKGKTKADKWNIEKQEKIRNILSDLDYSTVLEMGCGNGELSKILKEKNCVLVGLDISDPRIKNNNNLDFNLVIDVNNLKQGDIPYSKYDLVCCSHFLLHLNPKDVLTIIDKIKSLSKKNILFIEPHSLVDLGKWEYYNFKYDYDQLMNKKSKFVYIDKSTGAYLYD